LRQLCGQS